MTHSTTVADNQLTDRFGRHIDYLRISVTDRCDLRCVYCMSEDMQFVPRAQLLTLEEVIRIGRVFAELGVSKIRITGGEPLTRRNVIEVFNQLGKLDEIKDLTLTTNGTQLHRFADDLKRAGVTRINISLDTLQDNRFRRLTRTGKLHRTMAGIDAALEAGFDRIKLNSVILRNRNHDEIIDLVEFAHSRGMDISFIEEMPLGVIGDHNRAEAYISSDEILGILRQRHELIPTTRSTGGPARYYRRTDIGASIGFISPHSHNFCDDCNRVRLTAEGRLLLCLGQEHSVDLRRVIRANPTDDAPLRDAIFAAMDIKPRGHEFDLTSQPVILRHMNSTGG
ncbi:MAG TPA: GTP 3',8-cyclase MoaA [Gammaproteobacteria bacterium]|nr:GTP 3',8-cyclase MoaA [Gammaproteobacteria bacterium]